MDFRSMPMDHSEILPTHPRAVHCGRQEGVTRPLGPLRELLRAMVLPLQLRIFDHFISLDCARLDS
jgi:hypothetical protein